MGASEEASQGIRVMLIGRDVVGSGSPQFRSTFGISEGIAAGGHMARRDEQRERRSQYPHLGSASRRSHVARIVRLETLTRFAQHISLSHLQAAEGIREGIARRHTETQRSHVP